MAWLTEKPDGCDIAVKVTPRSSRNEILGVRDDRLLVRVTAAPDNGAANAAVVKLIAKRLRVGRTCLTIASGEAARQKRIHIAGVLAREVRDALAA